MCSFRQIRLCAHIAYFFMPSIILLRISSLYSLLRVFIFSLFFLNYTLCFVCPSRGERVMPKDGCSDHRPNFLNSAFLEPTQEFFRIPASIFIPYGLTKLAFICRNRNKNASFPNTPPQLRHRQIIHVYSLTLDLLTKSVLNNLFIFNKYYKTQKNLYKVRFCILLYK